jgi:CxxC motif-containing protein
LEVYGLANIKSAKKRVITSQVRADRNKAIKSKVKTYIKKRLLLLLVTRLLLKLLFLLL